MNRQESPMRRTLLPALILAAAPAFAWPTGPVQFVIPWPPGDLKDILTRMIAEDFQAAYGQPAAVINKPGGGGGPFPGAIDVATGPTDGSVIGSFVIDVPLVGDQIGIAELDPMPFEPVGIFLPIPSCSPRRAMRRSRRSKRLPAMPRRTRWCWAISTPRSRRRRWPSPLPGVSASTGGPRRPMTRSTATRRPRAMSMG
jgi:hypothetical protein